MPHLFHRPRFDTSWEHYEATPCENFTLSAEIRNHIIYFLVCFHLGGNRWHLQMLWPQRWSDQIPASSSGSRVKTCLGRHRARQRVVRVRECPYHSTQDFSPEDRGDIFSRNVGNLLQDCVIAEETSNLSLLHMTVSREPQSENVPLRSLLLCFNF